MKFKNAKGLIVVRYSKSKRLVAIALTVIMLISFTACKSSSEIDSIHKSPIGEKDTFKVVDQSGREVEIKNNVKSIAIAYGIPTNFILALGKGDNIVAISSSNNMYTAICPSLAHAGTVGKGRVDLEAMAKLNPDVFIHRGTDIETLESVSALGIPTIGISPESTEDILETIRLLGKALGAEQRAAELVDYYNKKAEFARSITSSIPNEKRYTAIVMGSEIGKVSSGKMLQSYLIETAGGINLAKTIDSTELWPVVGAEKIFQWNPDFIFLTNSSASKYNAEDLMTDPAWSELNAVKNNRVLMVPSDMDSWEFPGLGTLLGFLWMLQQMYPELYSEEQFLSEVDAFYNMAYGITFSRDFLGY